MSGELVSFGGKGITYGQQKFVAASQSLETPIAVSTDGGDTWSSKAGGLGKSFQMIAYNGNRFLAMANNGECLYSDDADYWYGGTTAPGGFRWAGIGGGDGRFVAVGRYGSMYSDDGGITWIVDADFSDPNNKYWSYVFPGPDKWVRGHSSSAGHHVEYSGTGTGESIDIAAITFQDDGAYNDSGEEQASLNAAFNKGDDVVSIPAGSTGTVVEAVDNTMELTDISGDWTVATGVKSTVEKTPDAPAPDRIVFTSSTPVLDSGTVTTWGNAEWQVATNSGFSNDVQTALVSITSPNDVQTVPDGTFTLDYDQQYYVRVSYNSDEPAASSQYSSNTHTFKTGSVSSSYSGALFYSKLTNNSITTDEVTKSYGINPNSNDMRDIGIYALTEQPDYPVLAYVPKGDEYKPIEDQD